MELTLGLVVAVIVLALAFDYTNGFHDAANAIATSVATHALTPRVALLLAAVMNFVGALLGQRVARTVAEVVSLPAAVDAAAVHRGLVVVIAALVGAGAWNVITWRFGLPSSSTQALIGGLGGAALAAGAQVRWGFVVRQVVVPMLASPLVGFVLTFALMIAFSWVFRRRDVRRVHGGFRVLQVFSASALALGHGLQDAQKTMGVIVLSLAAAYPARYSTAHLPLWVVLLAAAAIALGTASGGWRIMRTLGRRLVHLDPARAFSAETVGAAVLYAAAGLHAPISTTQTVTAAVMGAGATRRRSAVRWNVAGHILLAWVLTFPAAAAIAFLAFRVLALPL